MRFTTERSTLTGAVRIPGSKSHTVRAALLAGMADGISTVRAPLCSGDTESALAAALGLGAELISREGDWVIRGNGGTPHADGQTIDVGNSGTTLYLAMSLAALANGTVCFDGDNQIRQRSAANLIASLQDLGASITSACSNGCCPLTVCGSLRGGTTTIECPTSQYLSSLLLCAPLANGSTEIYVPLLYEQPYVQITLNWLANLGLVVDHADDWSRWTVQGGQRLDAFDKTVPADWSSATFFLCAAAMTGSELLVQGLDLADAQGDKAVIDYLRAMGAMIDETPDDLRVQSGTILRGTDLDLNETPDALPMMAVCAALADGTTVLGNVPQARMKETDRIAVMAAELGRLGVRVTEREDALEIEGGALRGGNVHGHGDHRIVMAFAIGGLAAESPITVDTAEAAAITFPSFADLVQQCGGALRVEDA